MKKKSIVIFSLIFGLIILLVYAPGYWNSWRVNHLIKASSQYYEKGDYRNAYLGVLRTLEINPGTIEALKLKSSILRNLQSQSYAKTYLDVAKRTEDADDWLIAFSVALESAQSSLSREIAQEVESRFSENLMAVQLLAWESLGRGDFQGARRFWQRLAASGEVTYESEFMLAVIAMLDDQSENDQNARDVLTSLTEDSRLGREATRFLLAIATQKQDWTEALVRSERAAFHAEASIVDMVNHANLLAARDPLGVTDFANQLVGSKITTLTRTAVIRVLLNSGYQAEAEELLNSVPVKDEPRLEVIEVRLEWFARQSQWDETAKILSLINLDSAEAQWILWDALIRFKRGKSETAGLQLRRALSVASDNVRTLDRLAVLARQYKWVDALRKIAWVRVEKTTRSSWAINWLMEDAFSRKDTSSLYRVLEHQLVRNPDSLSVRNDLANVLLLQGNFNKRALELASSVYQRDPQNYTYIATYALALTFNNQLPQALILFKKIEDSENPAVTLHHAFALFQSGHRDLALKALDGIDDRDFWPEEVKILSEIRNSTVAHAAKES